MLFLLALVLVRTASGTELYFGCLEESVDFTTAEALCEQRNMSLATIRNENDQENLKSLVRTETCNRK